MIKNATLFLLLVAFAVSMSFAQERQTKVVKMKTPDANTVVGDAGPNYTPSNPLAPGEEFLATGYDYMTNNATRNMIDLVDLDGDGSLDPIMVAMERLVEGGDRFIYFGYKAFGFLDKFNAFDPSQTPFGWGKVQYCEGGDLDGNALVMGHVSSTSWHSVIDLTNLLPVTPFPQTTFGGNFPDFVYLHDGTIITTNTDGAIRVSADYGATFDSLFLIGDGDANFDFAAATDFPSEYPISKSDDDMTIATFGVFAGAGVSGNPDVAYWYGSTDGGATWGGSIIGVGSGTNPEYGQISNRTAYAPYLQNFAQVSLNVDNMGVTHVTANGYGEGVAIGATDTTNLYGMLYWNSNVGQWIAVTSEDMETPDDGNGNAITDLYPGNGIGNAYGTVSVSENGQIVVVAWQGPEYTGAIGQSAYNVYPGDGGANSSPKYYTDIYYVVSEDGGATFSAPGILQGDAGVDECFPVLTRMLPVDGNTATITFLYYEDAIPGTSLFTLENGFSADGKWYYQTMDVTLATGVGDEGTVVNKFNLDQNYPNPFNPSTKISYSLAERSNVSLKVYDVLGNEVANLVNGTQEAGSHSLTFDGANLASGLYIYKIQAGQFTQSKKMMLLK